MKHILKSSTALVLALSLAVPQGAFAQAGEASGNIERNEQDAFAARVAAAEEAARQAELEAEAARAAAAQEEEKARRQAERAQARAERRAANQETRQQIEAAQQEAEKAQSRAERLRADAEAAEAQLQAVLAATEDKSDLSKEERDTRKEQRQSARQAARQASRKAEEAADAARIARERVTVLQSASGNAGQDDADDAAAQAEAVAAQQAADQAQARAERAQRRAEEARQRAEEAARQAGNGNQLSPEERAARKAERKAARKAARQLERAQDADAAPQLDSQAQADVAAQIEADDANVAAANGQNGSLGVESRQIGSDDVRRSDQEFSAAPQVESDSGLSNVEKIAILGLGALAVNQLLKQGDRVVSNSGDRVIVEGDTGLRVLKDDNALLERPGSEVTTERFSDGSTRSFVQYADGSQVVTVRAANGRVLRRTRILPDGRQYVLFDDTRDVEPVQVSTLPTFNYDAQRYTGSSAEQDLRLALQAQQADQIARRFSLAQVRNIDAVRRLVPEISVENVTFETGRAVIRPEQARGLSTLGNIMREAIRANPAEVFLIEGHTDAVGTAGANLALSDRRAETVALALTEYFGVSPENMVIQGYGESDLKIPVATSERANRRVTVRRVTPLLN